MLVKLRSIKGSIRLADPGAYNGKGDTLLIAVIQMNSRAQLLPITAEHNLNSVRK